MLFFSRKLLSLSLNSETNPGPRRNLNNHYTICNLNLDSISAHNFVKVHLLKAYLAVHKFDIVYLSGTYLNSSCPVEDEDIVEGTLGLRLDVVLGANILLNVVIDIFEKLFFYFEFVFQNMFVCYFTIVNQ